MTASTRAETVMPTCVPDDAGRCSLCADEAVEARVSAVDEARGMASVQLAGGAQVTLVALDLVDGIVAGDLVLVHQGFAIGRLGGPP